MPPVPIDEPLGYRRGRRVSYNEAVGTAPIPHGHAIVNSPPPNHPPQPKDQGVRYGGPYYEVRLLLGVIAHNLGNLLRRLVLPVAIQNWSLTSLQQRLFKTGGRLIRHARYFILQLAESHLTPTLFRQILGRIERPREGRRRPAKIRTKRV